MSISPPRLSNSSEEVWCFDSPPTTPGESKAEAAFAKGSPIMEAALAQLEILNFMEEVDAFSDKPSQRQKQFSSTIRVLASQECFKEAITTLADGEAKQVWQGYPQELAKTYLYIIERIPEKGVHDNAKDLYSRALEGGVWEGCAEQKQAAIQVLNQLGYHL